MYDGDRYTLVLEFESSLEDDKWEAFQPKIQSFFGPGIEARLTKTEKVGDSATWLPGLGLCTHTPLHQCARCRCLPQLCCIFCHDTAFVHLSRSPWP